MKTSEELKIQRFLKQTLDFLYARTVLELLNEVVKDNCYGCEIDHPSQTQHTCLMWTTTEHLDTYFEQTFNKIKYGDVIIQLREQVELMDIPNYLKNSVFAQFQEWCDIHKPKADTIRFAAEKLLSLENRFDK